MSASNHKPGQPGSMEELLGMIDPPTWQRLRRAVELGKWESGDRLTREQLANTMQLVIAYEHRHVPPDQRVGAVRSTAKACESRHVIATDHGGAENPD